MKVTKKKLVNEIQLKFDGQIAKLLIEDAINVINSYVEKSLLSNDSVSINNFGTLYVRIIDVGIGNEKLSEPVKNIMFVPHETFLELLKKKRMMLKTS